MESTNNVTPFRLPLDREQFRVALQKGLGRAPMHVAQFRAGGMGDLIVEACTTGVAYDAQCEDSRVPWLIGMIDAAGIENVVVPTILKVVRDDFATKTYWDKNQLCRLAFVFALRGHAEARDVLYAALSTNEDCANINAAEQIIQIDGADGLLHVAEKVGEWIRDNPKIWCGPHLVEIYDDLHGKGSAERILRPAAAHHRGIAAFIEEVDAQNAYEREPADSGSIRYWTAEDIVREIQITDPSENRNRFRYRRWGSKAVDDGLRTVFEALCVESDSARQRYFLHVFQECGFPELNSQSLNFADSDDSEIRWIAYQVLAKHKHPKIRSLALDRIKDGKIRERELELFIKNYEVGDWRLIQGALQFTGDADETHALLQDLMDIYEENRLPEAFEQMLLVYEHSPCSDCRSRAVRVLASIGSIPDWVRDECQHDSDESTREFVATQ